MSDALRFLCQVSRSLYLVSETLPARLRTSAPHVGRCYEPPADCTGEMCWPTEFCAPIEPGCPMMEGEWPEADEDDGYWLMALGKKNHHGRKRSHTHKAPERAHSIGGRARS